MNVALAVVALIFLAPVMVAVALAVFLQDGGPVVFAHRRIGRGGRYFYCLKFRSMAIDAEQRLAGLLATDPVARAEWERDHKLRNDPRVTRLGAFLRKTSLDELPQLFNVLRGEMSLVGPRPIVDAEIPKYGRRFVSYCAVKPGITGLWQVSGRNDTSYRSRVAMDCLYAKQRNVLMDGFIIAATVPAVLMRRGSY
jgi:lipopolysaccharide/colanic/teichoic acid biosynthesis glycosyltransferase